MVILPYHEYYPQQWEFAKACVFGNYKFAYLMWCRRAGKDDIFMNMLPIMMLRRVGVYYYLLPHYEQVRKTVWENVGQDGKRFIDYIPRELINKKRDSDMTIIFHNGSILKFLGSDNYENLRGPNPVGIIQAEYQNHNPKANADLYPIIAQNDGFMWKNGIYPETRNHAYHTWNAYTKDSNVYTDLQTWHTVKNAKNEYIYTEEMKVEAKKNMSQSEIDANYEMRLSGESRRYIYSSLMLQVLKDDRIKDFMIDKRFPLHVFFDLGGSKVEASLALWGIQICSDHFKAIVTMDFIGRSMEEALKELKTWMTRHHLNIGEVCIPHDGEHRTDYWTGENVIEKAAKQGIKLKLPSSLSVRSVKSGIQNGKDMIPMTIFHKTFCKKGIKALENYERHYNKALDDYGTPIKNSYSHLADAWRYAAQYNSRHIFKPSVVDILDHNNYTADNKMRIFRPRP